MTLARFWLARPCRCEWHCLLQMQEAEQQFTNTSQRVRKEYEAKLEEVRRAGEEDVHLRMDAGTKRIMQQNRSLQEELRIHIEVRC